MNKMDSVKPYYRILAYIGGAIAAIFIIFATCCTVVDSGEVGAGRCRQVQ